MRTLVYDHPGDIDGTPLQVARESVRDIDQAAEVYAEHVEAVVRQVRSGFLSALIAREPELSPAGLGAAWDRSPEAACCVALLRSTRGSLAAVHRLKSVQEGV